MYILHHQRFTKIKEFCEDKIIVLLSCSHSRIGIFCLFIYSVCM